VKRRIFIAIPLPQALVEDLVLFIDKTRLTGVNLTREENLHITVHFIGYVDDNEICVISDRINYVLCNAERFELIFDKIIFAPQDTTPRMIWAVFKDDTGMYRKITTTISDVLSEYSYKNNGELIPHVTLARFKNPRIADITRLEKMQPREKSFTVSGIELMESTLFRSGPVYKTIQSYKIL
jgi:2'-5' RNA ligase